MASEVSLTGLIALGITGAWMVVGGIRRIVRDMKRDWRKAGKS